MIFVEPLVSKRAAVVLKAVQRVYTKIRAGLTVRRIQSDNGREFASKLLHSWALARDVYQTFSVSSDPWVGKAGVRALLRTDGADKSSWPHAARQWGEAKFRQAMEILGGEKPRHPLVKGGCEAAGVVKKTPL